MILTSTSDIIRIVTSSTADVHAQTSWADITTTAFTPGRTNTVVTSATTTTIVASPGASTQRQVKTIVLYNAHASTANTVTIQHYDGTTSNTVYKYTLAAAESIEYNGTNWVQFDANGVSKSTTSLGILTSAQLAAALTDETGSGVAVFGTAPTFTTGITSPKITFNSTSGIIGTTTNDSAAAGSVGEYISAIAGSPINVTASATTQNALSIVLTPGDWDVYGYSQFQGNASTNVVYLSAAINPANNTVNLPYSAVGYGASGLLVFAGGLDVVQTVPVQRVLVANATTTTMYLNVYASFSISTCTILPSMFARRRR